MTSGSKEVNVKVPPEDLAPVVPIRVAKADEYDSAFNRIRGVATDWFGFLTKERGEAPLLFAELMEHSGKQRDLVLRNLERFHTWGLFELLTERSLTVSVEDPRLGEDLGLLALRLSEVMDAQRYHAGSLEDLRARAWAHVANARRIQSDLQGGDEAFCKAWRHLERGSQDPFERAILLDLDASLHRAQRRFDEAIRSLRRAVSIFRRLGEKHRAGRSLVNLAISYQSAGSPRRGLPLLQRALEWIDPAQEPRLAFLIRHNVVDLLAECGRFREAEQAARLAAPWYRRFPDARMRGRRLWVGGKIARGLGKLPEAEALFWEARDVFLAEEIPFETGLVSLDLALLYAQQRRMPELRRLAAELVPIFVWGQNPREALAALAIFQQAV
jgi:tetratricopeptide (TPR) repeat protein